MLIALILFAVVVTAIVRIVTAPFRYARRSNFGFGNPYYNPYRYGCRRRHGVVGGLLPIVALVAIDRLFGGRRF
jgi:hypothetical protein